jgi:hypothetical protein
LWLLSIFLDSIKTMGCHSGKVASPSSKDGVSGTLLASPTAAAKSVEQVPSVSSPKRQVIFEGRWQDEHGKSVGIIRDDRLIGSGGAPSQLRMDHTTGSIEVFYDDSSNKAAFGCFVDGKITWDDGRVWFRQEDTMEAEVVMPSLEPALTDAQASSCRQVETHAENAVTEKSEEVPHSESKPTLAVTRDTSQEQHVQEVFQNERQSEAEIEHHMPGVKSGEAVVDASEAQDENVRSPSGVTDSKVVGDKSDIKPMPTVPRKERCSVCC